MRRKSFSFSASAFFGFLAMFAVFCPINSWAQGDAKEPSRALKPIDEATPKKGGGPVRLPVDTRPPPDNAKEREAKIVRMLEAFDLRPKSAAAIPDKPPPHEGAMIPLPTHIIEAPDLMLIEVLEALPGQPISGERLVRPDGTISIGFYGDVKVAGLTLVQAKVAIIKHLRATLTDEVLGLEVPDIQHKQAPNPGPVQEQAPVPALPKEPNLSPPADEKAKPRTTSIPTHSTQGIARLRTTNEAASGVRQTVRRVRRIAVLHDEPVQKNEGSARNAGRLPKPGSGRITNTIDPGGQIVPAVPAAEAPAAPVDDEPVSWELVRPEDSRTVFVDITAYNSKYYYIQGDVQITGRITCTGNETVLDAINFGGGLTSSANPKDIRLVRPGVGGKPAKVYKVDLAGIQERGDVTTNYQIFPGDRLIVGRDPTVRKTAEIDRMIAPLQAMSGFMLQEAFTLRALQFATAGDRNQLLREYVDFFAKEWSKSSGGQVDEQTIRDAFTRKMNLPPNPEALAPSSTIRIPGQK